jgi:hypothetical protein
VDLPIAEIAEHCCEYWPPTPYQQQPGRPDLHRRTRPSGNSCALAQRFGTKGRAPRARDLTQGDRAVSRRICETVQQGARRFRPPRLDSLGEGAIPLFGLGSGKIGTAQAR